MFQAGLVDPLQGLLGRTYSFIPANEDHYRQHDENQECNRSGMSDLALHNLPDNQVPDHLQEDGCPSMIFPISSVKKNFT